MKNYEAEKLKKIIVQKEQAMIAQIEETDWLRNKLRNHKFTEDDMRESFYAGNNYYDFEPWIEEFKSKKNEK